MILLKVCGQFWWTRIRFVNYAQDSLLENHLLTELLQHKPLQPVLDLQLYNHLTFLVSEQIVIFDEIEVPP
ncbi:hypothetical protein C1H46_009541 [Malus baccata]|uniref:Uncharacterized protein n=1 Tax=Malus baccata TaxID=106549 RepID=A0A540N184_MALBA|nr:hypothetical protein C1H46_009541 [Malus baccata]